MGIAEALLFLVVEHIIFDEVGEFVDGLGPASAIVFFLFLLVGEDLVDASTFGVTIFAVAFLEAFEL